MATKTGLDYEYSPSAWSKRQDPVGEHINILTTYSNKSRNNVDCELEVPYGPMEKQKLDIYGANSLPKDAPVFVYIHGGYWQQLSLELSGFMVEPLVAAGAVVIAVGYELAPEVKMDEIVRMVGDAMETIFKWTKERGSRGVYVGGHSAGGHLAAMTLAKQYSSQEYVIKGALLVSGVFDVTPLVKTYVNDPIKMDHEEALRNSPVTHIDFIAENNKTCNIIVAVGENDPTTFRDQSKEFNEMLLTRDIDSQLLDVSGACHFDIIENLRDSDFILTKALIKMMEL